MHPIASSRSKLPTALVTAQRNEARAPGTTQASEGSGCWISERYAGGQLRRIHSGPGSAPLLAAATAWDALASELQTTARSYGSTVTELTSSGWQGPSSTAMTDAAAPYTTWLSNTAAQAERRISGQAAAAAYEAAFAASIPPPVIAANRALLAGCRDQLLGQNTPAIAANEATYAEFGPKTRARCTATPGRRHGEPADSVHRGARDHQRHGAGHSVGRCRIRRRVRGPTACHRG